MDEDMAVVMLPCTSCHDSRFNSGYFIWSDEFISSFLFKTFFNSVYILFQFYFNMLFVLYCIFDSIIRMLGYLTYKTWTLYPTMK